MVETEDVKGRTYFYEQVGVVRDTLQNHLMMMLSLLTMDINDNDTEEQNRLEIVKKIKKLSIEDSARIIGQYHTYNSHVNEDLRKWDEKELEKPSNQVTFAKIELNIENHDRWSNIPIYFTSGKALPQRRAFTKINFKDGHSLIINVQGKFEEHNVDGTTIKVINNENGKNKLPSFNLPSDEWKFLHGDGSNKDRGYHAILTNSNVPIAYEVLIRAALEGREESFVRLPEVMASWEIFTPLIKELENIEQEKLTKYKHSSGEGLNDPMNTKSNNKDEL